MTKPTITKMLRLARTLDSAELAGVASMLVLQAASGQDPVPGINQFHATLLETWQQMCDGTLLPGGPH